MVCISLCGAIQVQTENPISSVETLGRSSLTPRIKFILDCLFSWHLVFPRCAVGDYIFTLNCLIKTFLQHSVGTQSSSDAQFLSSLTPAVRENLHEIISSFWFWKLKSKAENVGVKSISQVTDIYRLMRWNIMCIFFLQGPMGVPGFQGINGIPVSLHLYK